MIGILLALLLLLTSPCAPCEAQSPSLSGNVSLQASSSDAPAPRIDGGFGRFQAGIEGNDDAGEATTGEVNLGPCQPTTEWR